MRRYKVTFHNGGLVPDTVLMDSVMLNRYAEYLASPEHAQLLRELRLPDPDQFRVETFEGAAANYLDGLPTEQLLNRRG